MLKFLKNTEKSDLIIAFLLFSLVLAAQSILAYIWQERNVLSQYDIIFDTDPIRWQITFADGWGPEHIMHPLSNYIVAVPIRIIQVIGSMLGLIEDGGQFRIAMVTYVSPFFTALKAVCFYSIFRLLSFTRIQALLITTIAALSFSSVVFGSVPSSYPITGFSYAFLTMCTILLIKNKNRLTTGSFYIASIFSVGVSSSNIIFVGWMKWFENLSSGLEPFKGLIKAVLGSVLILIGVLIMFFALNLINSKLTEREPAHSEISNLENFLGKYIPSFESQMEKAVRFPEFMTRTVIPTVPVNNPTTDLYNRTDPIKVELSYLQKDADLFSVFFAILAFISIGGAARIALKREDLLKPLALSSLAAIGTFWIFFSWMGLGVYLFSQNWYVPIILLLGVWLKTDFFNSKLGRGLISVLLIYMFVTDIYVLNEVTQRFVPT